ncbi:uncharacterized protein A4U43_C06F2490 [Asparagus officinalis]|uniref:Uncharacterized protein n=1 Tax=Asparagus officinalis TaxID=4686 RepID=A0A5P1EJH9_ASPOF|nr:uncharacterized protein A4U43_C06F2490 [Asparagus officinalis]
MDSRLAWSTMPISSSGASRSLGRPIRNRLFADDKVRVLVELFGFKLFLICFDVSFPLKMLMKMLLDIEDEPVWHSAEAEDEDAEEMRMQRMRMSQCSMNLNCQYFGPEYHLFILLGLLKCCSYRQRPGESITKDSSPSGLGVMPHQ